MEINTVGNNRSSVEEYQNNTETKNDEMSREEIGDKAESPPVDNPDAEEHTRAAGNIAAAITTTTTNPAAGAVVGYAADQLNDVIFGENDH